MSPDIVYKGRRDLEEPIPTFNITPFWSKLGINIFWISNIFNTLKSQSKTLDVINMIYKQFL